MQTDSTTGSASIESAAGFTAVGNVRGSPTVEVPTGWEAETETKSENEGGPNN